MIILHKEETLFRLSIDHYAVPASNLQQLEATAICANIGGGSVKLVTVYFHHCAADFSGCFSGGKLVLLVGDLNIKHRDWNSGVNSPIVVLLRVFASVNSCIFHRPDIFSSVVWYVSNLQLHEDLKVPYLDEHIRNHAQNFNSKIPDSENLSVWQYGIYLFYPRDLI